MKWLIFLFVAQSALATSLAQYHSSPDGSSEQRFELSKSKAIYLKRSNFFDQNKTLSLGNFETEKLEVIKDELKKIDEILERVEIAEKILKQRNKSFNDLSDKYPHSSFILLNDFRITQSSDLYPELKKIFDQLQRIGWKETSIIKLSDDFKSVSVIKNGKVTSKESFNFAFYCKQPQAPTVCTFKNFGILYVQ
jgi:hypothetical protein